MLRARYNGLVRSSTTHRARGRVVGSCRRPLVGVHRRAGATPGGCRQQVAGRSREQPDGFFSSIRVLEDISDSVVPIIRWINPGRKAWVQVPPSGLNLMLPEGRYRVQTSQYYEGSFIEATVAADRVTTVDVVY